MIPRFVKLELVISRKQIQSLISWATPLRVFFFFFWDYGVLYGFQWGYSKLFFWYSLLWFFWCTLPYPRWYNSFFGYKISEKNGIMWATLLFIQLWYPNLCFAIVLQVQFTRELERPLVFTLNSFSLNKGKMQTIV